MPDRPCRARPTGQSMVSEDPAPTSIRDHGTAAGDLKLTRSALGPHGIGTRWSSAGTSGPARQDESQVTGGPPLQPRTPEQRWIGFESHLTAAAGQRPLPTRQASPGTGSSCGQVGTHTGRPCERRPRRPCHYCAIHSSHDRSPADTHGRCHGCLNLRPSFPPQVTALPELALQAGGRRFESGGSHHQLWLPS
jgi:hypothetical protein